MFCNIIYVFYFQFIYYDKIKVVECYFKHSKGRVLLYEEHSKNIEKCILHRYTNIDVVIFHDISL